MAWAVTTEGERIVMAFRTVSSGQVLVFFYTHNDNSTCQYILD